MTAPRVGILGGGFMARVHAHAARSARAELVAIASSSQARAAEAAAALGVAHALPDAASLVAADVDVVHVCTPNTTHATLAAQAIAAGRHVVCEKPLATSVDEAQELVDALDDAGLVGAVPFVYRYHPMVREARARLAASGAALLSVDAAYLQDWMLLADDENWRAGSALGGPSRAFADIGSHLLDLVEFVAGERIASLAATTRTVFDQRGDASVANEDIAGVLFRLEGGAVGTALVTQMAPGRKNALTIEWHAADASYRFEQERPDELWIGERAGSRLLQRDPESLSPDAARLSRVPAGHPMGYQDAFDAFVADAYAAIAGATPDGLPTFRDGLRAAVLTDAVLRSAASGEWIETTARARSVAA
ncbi:MULTISPECIES: Gfo/Idh/MocA family protein [unclassified Agrococcus]|uniref:Gfo/Idh/MocA family protein n=1 Tax=unclassified Agrococcus TaxID=2615065 RepID=UPI00361EEF5F